METENRFVLFVNEDKKNPKGPDFSGTATPTCSKCGQINEYRLSGWKGRSDKGVKYVNGPIEPKEDQKSGGVPGWDDDDPSW